MQNLRNQGHQIPVLLKRGLAGVTSCGISSWSFFAHAEIQTDAPAADYGATELAQLESLDELVPENLFTIEATTKRRLDTSGAPLAQADNTGQAYANALDSREPLLFSSISRLLPAKVFDLSPVASSVDNDAAAATGQRPGVLWAGQTRFGRAARIDGRRGRIHSGISGAASLNLLHPSCSAQILHRVTPTTTRMGCLPQSSCRITPKTSFPATSRCLCCKRTMPLPRNRTEITPSPYLTLIHGVTEFVEEMEYSAYRRQPQEQLALQDLVRRLTNSVSLRCLSSWLGGSLSQNAATRSQSTSTSTTASWWAIWRSLWVDICTPKQHCGCNRHRLSTAAVEGYAVLDQSQRMRSGELHYFDHLVRYVGSNRQSLTTSRAASELRSLLARSLIHRNPSELGGAIQARQVAAVTSRTSGPQPKTPDGSAVTTASCRSNPDPVSARRITLHCHIRPTF